jgi:hypothetical protein
MNGSSLSWKIVRWMLSDAESKTQFDRCAVCVAEIGRATGD